MGANSECGKWHELQKGKTLPSKAKKKEK